MFIKPTTIRPEPAVRGGCLAVALLCCTGAAVAEPGAESGAREWSQYLGPERNAIADDTGLVRSWPAEGPKVLWRKELGEGFSGVTVAGDLLYTMFADEERDFAAALRIADGSEVWRRDVGKKFFDEWGNGPRATPTLDGDVAYVLASLGGLYALDRHTGEIRWQLDLAQHYPVAGGPGRLAAVMPPDARIDPSEFAHAASPLVVDDRLIVYTGAAEGNTLLAVDKHTGEVLWGTADNLAGFSSPTLLTLAEQRQIVTVLHTELLAVSPAGETLWKHPLGVTMTQPVAIAPDKVLATATFDVGAMLLQVRPGAEQWTVEPVWNQRLLRHGWCTPVVHDGHVYGFDHATMRCLSLETGEVVWSHRGLGKATMVLADGLLIVLTDRGRVVLAEASSEGFEPSGAMDVFEGPSWTPPTVARGKLYLRNQHELVALDLQEPAP